MTPRKHWLDFQNEEIGFSLKEAFLRPPAKHPPGVEQRQRGGPDHYLSVFALKRAIKKVV